MSTTAAATTGTRPVLSMKLLIDTKARRVLFAEANKDVVDFLFSLLALPIATATRPASSSSPRVRRDLQDVDHRRRHHRHEARAEHEAPHRHQGAARAVRGGEQGRGRLPLLPPRPARRHRRLAARDGLHGRQRRPPLRQRREAGRRLRPARRRPGRAPPPRNLLAGGGLQHLPPPPAGHFVGSVQQVLLVRPEAQRRVQQLCPPRLQLRDGRERYQVPQLWQADDGCHLLGATRFRPGGGTKGFVQGVVTYTVTDNLTVTPMSSISSITLLNSLGVRDFGALQEKTVRLGSTAGLAILKASLKSKTVLTDVFLRSV